MSEAALDVPVRVRRLNERNRLFILEYLSSFDPGDAYIKAGYEVADKEMAAKCGSRLLKRAEVKAAIDDLQCDRMGRLHMDADWVVVRWHRIYLEAITKGEFAAANKALENIAKCLGLFEEHNRQKAGRSEEEVIRSLKERGIPIDLILDRKRVRVIETNQTGNGAGPNSGESS